MIGIDPPLANAFRPAFVQGSGESKTSALDIKWFYRGRIRVPERLMGFQASGFRADTMKDF